MSSSACSCSSLVCAPWQKTRPNTVSGAPSPRFVFCFLKSFYFVPQFCVCPAAWKSPLVIPAIAHCKSAWEVGGIAASAASPLAASPHARRSREISALPAVALPSPPAGFLVPGLPLPQARRSREITPPDRCWLNARRSASDSMPAGPPLTLCPPDRRWLKPARSPLTQARRIAADSCPPAAAIPSPVDQVHMSRPGVPCVCLVVPTGTF